MTHLKEITMGEWMDNFSKLPSEIRYLKITRAFQKLNKNGAPLIGVTFYEDCMKKYPEHFDENGELKK